jgi:hypothetical protein
MILTLFYGIDIGLLLNLSVRKVKEVRSGFAKARTDRRNPFRCLLWVLCSRASVPCPMRLCAMNLRVVLI